MKRPCSHVSLINTRNQEPVKVRCRLTAAAGEACEPAVRNDAGAQSSRGADGESSVAGFGVRVDLKSFFSDVRGTCWVWVEATQPVRWLLRRLRARLSLPARLALLAPQGLLHPSDPLALLRPAGTVRVVPIDYDLFVDCCTEPATAMGVDEPCVAELERKQCPSRSPSRVFEVTCDASDALLEMKQRALALLEQCVAAEEPEPSTVDPARSSVLKSCQGFRAQSSECSSPARHPSPERSSIEPSESQGLEHSRRRRRRVRRRPRRALCSTPPPVDMVDAATPGPLPAEEATGTDDVSVDDVAVEDWTDDGPLRGSRQFGSGANEHFEGGANRQLESGANRQLGSGARCQSVTRNEPGPPQAAPRLIRALPYDHNPATTKPTVSFTLVI